MDTIEFCRSIPNIGTFDVVVCGGGPAGFIAAIASARNGARTALVEQYGFLGGTATAALVNPISEFNCDGNRVVGGIPWEFVERLHALGGALNDFPNGNVPFDSELYKLTAQRMVLEAGVELFLHATVAGVETAEDGRIKHIVITSKGGLQAVKARYYLDCTGDADLSSMAGVPFLPSNPTIPMQPATLYFILAGVDTDRLETIYPKLEHTRYYNKRVHDIFEKLRDSTEIPNFGGPWFCTVLKEGMVSVNLTRRNVDPTNIKSLSAAECVLREDVLRFTALLQEHIPEFKNCMLVATGTQVGIRESRRIQGYYVLTGDDIIQSVHFEDSIACSAHPVDIHSAKDSKQEVRFLDHVGYIPLRSLMVPGFPNLFVAGRSLSADSVASASCRVQAPVMAMGQAAGTAASECARIGIDVQKIDVKNLQAVLINQGAVL